MTAMIRSGSFRWRRFPVFSGQHAHPAPDVHLAFSFRGRALGCGEAANRAACLPVIVYCDRPKTMLILICAWVHHAQQAFFS